MDAKALVDQARLLRQRIRAYGRDGDGIGNLADAAQAQVCEFFRRYSGISSSFTARAEKAGGYNSHRVNTLSAILDSYVEYLEAGLDGGVSPERKAQLEVVSDILSQAQTILDNKSYHPAAAAVLIGASLEEFLRTWVERTGLEASVTKATIDGYVGALRAAELVTKQDAKDIASWAGVRNDAAHGRWDDVADRQRIRLMLEGVNLFMRKYAD